MKLGREMDNKQIKKFYNIFDNFYFTYEQISTFGF